MTIGELIAAGKISLETKVLGELPMTADGVIVGDVQDHGALVFLNSPGDFGTPYRMTLCMRCVGGLNDVESEDWDVVENCELSPGANRWYSTREAAEAARSKTQ